MNKSFNTNTPKVVGSITISILVAVSAYFLIISPLSKEDDETTNSTKTVNSTQQSELLESEEESVSQATSTPTTTNASQSVSSTPSSTIYKNGTYTASIDYSAPKGAENSISVELTIANDTITAVTTDNQYEDRESGRYIDSFENSVSTAVKGKKLSQLSIGRIGGASLTSNAFEEAINDIIAEAKI